jgi:hypothetical protein
MPNSACNARQPVESVAGHLLPAQPVQLGIQGVNHPQRDRDGLARSRAQPLDTGQPVAVAGQQIPLRRRAEVIQGGVHPLLPPGALISEILVQADPGPGLQH